MSLQYDINPVRRDSAVSQFGKEFDIAKAELEEEGYHVISVPVNAKLRIMAGPQHNISAFGNWTKEGVLYVKARGNILVRHSPILDLAELATQQSRDRKEFYLNDTQIEKAINSGSITVPNVSFGVPTNRLGEDEVMVFAIGGGNSKDAQNYGDFLAANRIYELRFIPVHPDQVKETPQSFVRQLWFSGLLDRSVLDTNYRKSLSSGHPVRGEKIII